MGSGRAKTERRQAKRINVDMRIKIAKASCKTQGRLSEEWVDVARLKNISHLGAYFEYQGPKRLNPGDILIMDLDVSLPLENKDIDSGERLPIGGLAGIVRTRQNRRHASLGAGVRFLEPLSMKLNSA